ncbi:MAG: hypothetical protein IKR48_13800 [Kiritimatiellae bacterium]|nr:hypothetical protein [Kiritimatiellia bacterium]
MKVHVFLIVSILLGGCRIDDSFYIHQYSSGLLFGPFHNKDFSEVKLSTFNDETSCFPIFDGYIVHPTKWQIESYRRLHKTIVSIDVRDQTIEQFAETLNEIQRKNGVSESDRIGFSVRIHPSWFGEELIPNDDVFVTGKFIRRKRTPPLITLHVEDASLFKVLFYLSHLLSYKVIYFEYGREVELYLRPIANIQ